MPRDSNEYGTTPVPYPAEPPVNVDMKRQVNSFFNGPIKPKASLYLTDIHSRSRDHVTQESIPTLVGKVRNPWTSTTIRPVTAVGEGYFTSRDNLSKTIKGIADSAANLKSAFQRGTTGYSTDRSAEGGGKKFV